MQMHSLAFDVSHTLAGGLVLISLMMLYQDRLYSLLNVFALHALVLSLSVASRLVPLIVLMVPLYVMFRRYGLLNSLTGVVVAEVGFLLPYAVLILVPYFAALPAELEDAARIAYDHRAALLSQSLNGHPDHATGPAPAAEATADDRQPTTE